MKGNRSTGQFAGKGFYIVLFLSIAVIGVAGFTITNSTRNLTNIVQPSPFQFPTPQPTQPAVAVSPTPQRPPQTPTPPTAIPPTEAPPAIVPPYDAEPVQEAAAATFFVRPVDAALPTVFVEDALTFNPTLGVWRFHGGLDIYADLGSPVMSVADGEVENVDIDILLGNVVVIRHAGGLTSLYANLDSAIPVSVGDRVSAGDVIGAVGNSAPSKALQDAHLHFEMTQNGEVVNPLRYLPQ